jgi:anti-sigma factor RsiW
MTCNDIQDRLVDYLYGELPEADRNPFDAHLGSCPDCRREVAGLGATLARTRAVVRTALDEPPPARVRVAVLAAAARALHERAASPAADVSPVASAAAGEPLAARLRRWLRRPWVLPAFAAVSVAAVFVVARQTITIPERASALAPGASREPGSSPPLPAVPPPVVSIPAVPRKPLRLREIAADPPVPRAQYRREDIVAEGSAGHRPAVYRKGGSSDVLRGATGTLAADVDGRAGLRGPEELNVSATSEETFKAARVEAPASAAKVRPMVLRDVRANAPAPSAASPAAPEPEPAAPTGAGAPAARSSASHADLVGRAARAFTGGRWADAAAAYRELLRRFAGDRSAGVWRARLVHCEQALAQ